jgi:pimeloyl-ACP methyl ester carboxylesterase
VPRRRGLVDVGTGSPVLLVHGQPGVGKDWDVVVQRARHGHRLLVPDRPGYGDGPDAAQSMASNAQWLADLLVEHQAAPATVVGHSYGGGIALLLAASHPELVSGLVLVGSVGVGAALGVVDRVLTVPLVGEGVSAVGLAAMGRVLPPLRPLAADLPGRAGKWLAAALPDAAHASADLGRPGGQGRVRRSFVVEQRALVDEIADVEASAETLAVPTVVIVGEWDVVVPPAVGRRLAATIAGAELVAVPEVGHFLPRDRADVVVDAIRTVVGRPAEEEGTGTDEP